MWSTAYESGYSSAFYTTKEVWKWCIKQYIPKIILDQFLELAKFYFKFL